MNKERYFMQYKAVLFDFDYTLGDATDAILAGFTHGMTTLGFPAPERESVRRTVGMLLEDAYTLLSGDVTEAGRTAFRDLFSQVARPMQKAGIPLCTGAAELLATLHEHGIATAVVSTKHTPTLQAILAHHGLDSILSAIIGGDLVEHPKPDPEGLLMALDLLNVTTAEVLFCGDTVIDAETAKRGGVDFCAVLNGTTPAEAFVSFPCKHIAPDLPDLRRWLAI